MQQTYNIKFDEFFGQSRQQVDSQSKKRFAANRDRLLLICDGFGNIVFAYGNSWVLGYKTEELQHRNLFKMGFTQYSLYSLANFGSEGLLEHNRHNKSFTLQLVKKISNKRQISEREYYKNQQNYLSLVELRCSLTKIRFSEERLTYRQCQVNRMPISLADVDLNQSVLALVEIKGVSDSVEYNTSYQDFLYTLKLLPPQKEKLSF